jgi:hypothetical protein
MFKKTIILIILAGALILGSQIAYGAGILPDASGNITYYKDANGNIISSNCPSGNKNECGLYAVNDFVALAINVSKWILGIVGSLSLIMFIYGGFMFLISAGSADAIGKAKKIIIAAVIGLAIVFSSYLIIKFVLGSMGLNWEGKIEKPIEKPKVVSTITSRLV